jgi:PilZ domain
MGNKENSDLPPLAERRARPRRKVLFGGVIVYDRGRGTFNCRIRDLTENGVKISISRTQTLPPDFYFISIRDQVAYKSRIAWRAGDEAGLTFETTHDLSTNTDPELAYLRQIWAARNSTNVSWK